MLQFDVTADITPRESFRTTSSQLLERFPMNTFAVRPSDRWMLRLAAVLWVVWGLVHTLAGVLTMALPTADAVKGIADDVAPALLDMTYPDAVGAVINQHGFNLFWIGLVTVVCAILIWRRSAPAIALAALVGGLADVGYFLFLDLGGFVKFVPGTVMTLFSSAAIVLSVVAYSRRRPASA